MGRKKKYTIGFDCGGTKLLCGILDQSFTVVSAAKQKTPAAVGGNQLLDAFVNLIEKTVAQSAVDPELIAGVGIGVPSPVDPVKGVVKDAANLGFRNFPLKSRLQKRLSLPVFVENDVNAGTWGECINGAGAGGTTCVGVFIGTGIGGGLVFNNRLFRGAGGYAGEIGHMLVYPKVKRCGCGKSGCLEAFCSRSALSREAAGLAAIGQAPTVLFQAGTDIKKIKSRVLSDALSAGDPGISAILNECIDTLGIGLANVVNLLNPDIIILGGGLVEKLGSSFVQKVNRAVKRYAMPALSETVTVRRALLGDNAVLVGAAALLNESIKG